MMEEGIASEVIRRAKALKRRWMLAWCITFAALIASNAWRVRR